MSPRSLTWRASVVPGAKSNSSHASPSTVPLPQKRWSTGCRWRTERRSRTSSFRRRRISSSTADSAGMRRRTTSARPARRSADRETVFIPPLPRGSSRSQREQRGAPVLFRRQEGEPARPDGVRPERRSPELGPHAIHDLDPGGRRGGDLLRGATDETARDPKGPRRATPGPAGRGGAHATPAAAAARAETAPFDRGAWHGIVDTSGASAAGSLAARRPRFTRGPDPDAVRRPPRSRGGGRRARSPGRRPP